MMSVPMKGWQQRGEGGEGDGGDDEVVGSWVVDDLGIEGCGVGSFDTGVRRECGFRGVVCRGVGGVRAERVPHISLE